VTGAEEDEYAREVAYIQNVLLFPFFDEDEHRRNLLEWKRLRRLDWYVVPDMYGVLYVGIPSVWIMHRKEFIRLPEFFGGVCPQAVPQSVFPAVSKAVAHTIAEFVRTAFPGLRYLGIVTMEDVRSLNAKEEKMIRRNLKALVESDSSPSGETRT